MKPTHLLPLTALVAAFVLSSVATASAAGNCVELGILYQPKYENKTACLAMKPRTEFGKWVLLGWFVESNEITEAEGALSTETEEELALEDTKTIAGKVAILCKFTLDGTVGPEERSEIVAVITTTGEKIEAGLVGAGLLCKTVSGCEASTTDIEVWPLNLPWLPELQPMESEPEILDRIFGSEGKEPGWEVKCLVLGISIEDSCQGETSAKLEDTSEGKVLVTFNPAAPTSSQAVQCSQGGAGSGVTTGEGSTSLTSHKALAIP